MAPILRPLEMSAAVIYDRTPTDLRSWRSSSDRAIARRSWSRTLSMKSGSRTSASPSTMCSGIEGSLAAILGSSSLRRGSAALTATRSIRSVEITSIMHMSASSGTLISVIRSRVEDNGEDPSAAAAT